MNNNIRFRVGVTIVVVVGLASLFFVISYLNILPRGFGSGTSVVIGYYVESEYGDDAIYQEASEGDPEQIIFLVNDSDGQYLPDDLETGDRIQIEFGGLLDQDENGIWSLNLNLTHKVKKRITWFQVVTDDVIAQVNEQAALFHGN